MVILLMTELDESFSGVDGAIKSYADKLIRILNCIPGKTTNSVIYDIVQSYEWLFSSESTYWSAQEDFDKLVAKK